MTRGNGSAGPPSLPEDDERDDADDVPSRAAVYGKLLPELAGIPPLLVVRPRDAIVDALLELRAEVRAVRMAFERFMLRDVPADATASVAAPCDQHDDELSAAQQQRARWRELYVRMRSSRGSGRALSAADGARRIARMPDANPLGRSPDTIRNALLRIDVVAQLHDPAVRAVCAGNLGSGNGQDDDDDDSARR